jgi:phosphatidylethanolamine/phosphatidyl-N-methylethanolamine N-methyltransferase
LERFFQKPNQDFAIQSNKTIQLHKKFEFLKEGILNLRTVGSFVRASEYLAETMAEKVDFSTAKVIVELGAGDGAITEKLLENLQIDATLLIFEINEAFFQVLNEKYGHDPRVKIIADSAEFLEKYLLENGHFQADAIVSALPFLVFSDELADVILRACQRALRSGGRFVQYHYSPRKNFYEGYFGNADQDFVARNVPPAFVIVCQKK